MSVIFYHKMENIKACLKLIEIDDMTSYIAQRTQNTKRLTQNLDRHSEAACLPTKAGQQPKNLVWLCEILRASPSE